MILSVLEIRYHIFFISNKRKHTNFKHLCFQNTFYKLDVSGYHGNGGDGFEAGTSMPNNEMAFTTYDQDHDNWNKHCASLAGGAKHGGGGGWWFNNCGYTRLNGLNYGHAEIVSNSMSCYKFGNSWESLKTISMAIRPIRL